MQSEEEGARVPVPGRRAACPGPWLAGSEASVCALCAGLVNHRHGDRAQRGRLEEGVLAEQTPLGAPACGPWGPGQANPIRAKAPSLLAALPGRTALINGEGRGEQSAETQPRAVRAGEAGASCRPVRLRGAAISPPGAASRPFWGRPWPPRRPADGSSGGWLPGSLTSTPNNSPTN